MYAFIETVLPDNYLDDSEYFKEKLKYFKNKYPQFSDKLLAYNIITALSNKAINRPDYCFLESMYGKHGYQDRYSITFENEKEAQQFKNDLKELNDESIQSKEIPILSQDKWISIWYKAYFENFLGVLSVIYQKLNHDESYEIKRYIMNALISESDLINQQYKNTIIQQLKKINQFDFYSLPIDVFIKKIHQYNTSVAPFNHIINSNCFILALKQLGVNVCLSDVNYDNNDYYADKYVHTYLCETKPNKQPYLIINEKEYNRIGVYTKVASSEIDDFIKKFYKRKYDANKYSDYVIESFLSLSQKNCNQSLDIELLNKLHEFDVKHKNIKFKLKGNAYSWLPLIYTESYSRFVFIILYKNDNQKLLELIDYHIKEKNDKPLFMKNSMKTTKPPFLVGKTLEKYQNDNLFLKEGNFNHCITLDNSDSKRNGDGCRTVKGFDFHSAFDTDYPYITVSEYANFSHETRCIVKNGRILATTPAMRKSSCFLSTRHRIHPYFTKHHNSDEWFEDRNKAAEMAWFVRKVVKAMYEKKEYLMMDGTKQYTSIVDYDPEFGHILDVGWDKDDKTWKIIECSPMVIFPLASFYAANPFYVVNGWLGKPYISTQKAKFLYQDDELMKQLDFSQMNEIIRNS